MPQQNNKLFLKNIDINTFFQFIKFGVVGLSNTIVSSAVYFIFVYIGMYYIIANTIAFAVGVVNSFFWNNKYVFREKRGITGLINAFIRTFIAYSITGLVLSNILLFIFVDILNISKYIALFLGLLITIPLNFILNKFWAFRVKKEQKNTKNNFNEGDN